MTFNELYGANCNWDSWTIVRAIILDGEVEVGCVEEEVSTLASVAYFSENEVITFFKNTVILKN